MTYFKILFDTKNHRRVPSMEFVLPAKTAQEAEYMATIWMKNEGEIITNFKKPKTRMLNAEEIKFQTA